jgi:hypothetical protein
MRKCLLGGWSRQAAQLFVVTPQYRFGAYPFPRLRLPLKEGLALLPSARPAVATLALYLAAFLRRQVRGQCYFMAGAQFVKSVIGIMRTGYVYPVLELFPI